MNDHVLNSKGIGTLYPIKNAKKSFLVNRNIVEDRGILAREPYTDPVTKRLTTDIEQQAKENTSQFH